MAIDREESLRRAEKLLRQGRLDGAIQEYARLLEEQPNDWNTRNVLGDLYVRANKPDLAVAQFTQIADHFANEGFLPRAIALYKKVAKIKPDDEHALLQAAEINARQGLLADAKSALATIAEQRRRRGDQNGSNEILIRIATLDPADLTAGLAAARAAAEFGDAGDAALRYKQLAGELFGRDRAAEGIDALAEAVRLHPADDAARNSLVAAYLNGGDFDRARQWATTGGHFRALADCLSAHGRKDEAMDALSEAMQRDPGDNATRTHLVRTLLQRGDVERARECLRAETVGDDPGLRVLAGEVELRAGRSDAAFEHFRAAIAGAPVRRDEVTRIGCALAASDRETAFRCVEIAAEAAAAAHEYAAAAACLQQYLAKAASHIPALIKLVDVCVDGDLDEALSKAQADLAESYLAAGRAFEARVIAEDLVTRAPNESANVDRFRRALVMLGEPDPDTIIADRLHADPSLAIDDLNADLPQPGQPSPEASPARVLPFSRNAGSEETRADDSEAPEDHEEAVAAGGTRGAAPGGRVGAPGDDASDLGARSGGMERRGVAEGATDGAADRSESAAPGERTQAARGQPAKGKGETASRAPKADDPHPAFDMEAATLDLDAILGSAEEPEAAADTSGDFIEIDLSNALADIGAPGTTGPAAGSAPASSSSRSGLDDVFEDLRQEVANEQATNTAAQHYKLAVTYHDMGMTEECIKALQVAVRSPRYRFEAASLLGRIHRSQGRTHDAIDWFERAAESPAPGVDAGRALLYELGQALEDEGESVRALAVYLELQADAGDYRDVAARVKRLSR